MKSKVILFVLLLLSAIGAVRVLQTNATMLIISILLSLGIIVFLNRYMQAPRRGPGRNDQGYQKALRSQKKRSKLKPTELQKLTSLKRTSREIPFKVIEGRKSKSTKDKQKPKHKQSNFH
jgi:hypothetical protein